MPNLSEIINQANNEREWMVVKVVETLDAHLDLVDEAVLIEIADYSAGYPSYIGEAARRKLIRRGWSKDGERNA